MADIGYATSRRSLLKVLSVAPIATLPGSMAASPWDATIAALPYHDEPVVLRRTRAGRRDSILHHRLDRHSVEDPLPRLQRLDGRTRGSPELIGDLAPQISPAVQALPLLEGVDPASRAGRRVEQMADGFVAPRLLHGLSLGSTQKAEFITEDDSGPEVPVHEEPAPHSRRVRGRNPPMPRQAAISAGLS